MCSDYKEAIGIATQSDIIYMDPPYQGVCGNRDPRYLGDISFNGFVETLYLLNTRGIAYIVSYDGRNDLHTYGKPLPPSLNLTYIELNAGRSTQATLLGLKATTIESLYLSPALVSRLDSVLMPEIESSPKQPLLI